MFTVEASIQIDRPQEDVWALHSDPTRFVEWCGNVRAVTLTTNGSTGVGTRMVIVEKLMGRDLEWDSQIEQYDPPHILRYSSSGPSMHYELTQISEASGSGTHVTISMTVEPEGFFKVAQPMLKRETQQQIAADLQRLKAVVEG